MMHSSNAVRVQKVESDSDIIATQRVMLQLRSALPPDAYLPTVRRMMYNDGYRLTAVYDNEEVRAVAGYRFMEMLYAGRIMYVDDLNTDECQRSRGYGKILMDWLKAEARSCGCAELHLDTGVHRENTHRFYFRERLTINCYHFRVLL